MAELGHSFVASDTTTLGFRPMDRVTNTPIEDATGLTINSAVIRWRIRKRKGRAAMAVNTETATVTTNSASEAIIRWSFTAAQLEQDGQDQTTLEADFTLTMSDSSLVSSLKTFEFTTRARLN